MTVASIAAPVASWCHAHLQAEPAALLFAAGALAEVVGLRLDDGREVVVKARRPAERIHGCVEVQRRLWERGFPCPEPLAGPAPLADGLTATAEALVAGGEQLPVSDGSPGRFADALAELVALAPSPAEVAPLSPPPPWLWWEHGERGVWPPTVTTAADLNERPEPRWLDELAARARERLLRCGGPDVVGHGDFESQNLRWRAGKLHAVFDWDSVVARPEPAIAGAAAAMFPATGAAAAAASLRESADFLGGYELARGAAWSEAEREVCWAAGLWALAYNAKIETIEGRSGVLAVLAGEGARRLELAGA